MVLLLASGVQPALEGPWIIAYLVTHSVVGSIAQSRGLRV